MSKFKISDTIVTKSDQLNAEDLLTGSRIITVTGHKQVKDPKQPLIIYYEGDNGRPFKPCLTMRKILEIAYDDNPDLMIGQQFEVYNDETVSFGNEKTGGVRISALTGIRSSFSVPLTITRGKKKVFHIKKIEPVELPPYPTDKFADAFDAMKQFIIDGKMTHEQVINKCEQTGRLSDEQKDQIRAVEVDDEPQFIDGE